MRAVIHWSPPPQPQPAKRQSRLFPDDLDPAVKVSSFTAFVACHGRQGAGPARLKRHRVSPVADDQLLDHGSGTPTGKFKLIQWQRDLIGSHVKLGEASRLVQVPPGVLARLVNPEVELLVRHPDYVAIGAAGEVYANAAEWVAENLSFE